MHGFLLERLFPTGWRLSGELFWRFSDAERESQRSITEGEVRGVRVLSARINSDAVVELLADSRQGVPDVK